MRSLYLFIFGVGMTLNSHSFIIFLQLNDSTIMYVFVFMYMCVYVCMYIYLYNGKSVVCDGSLGRPFMVDPLSYFSFHPLFHDWYNKGRGVCYPVCGMVHMKEPLLLIEKSGRCRLVAAAGFLSRCLICPLPYVRRHNRK